MPERVAYNEWFEDLELPDTFASWFIVTELHVWLLLVRYMAEDVTPSTSEKSKYVKGDGHFVRNCIIEALWADVTNRIKFLEVLYLIFLFKVVDNLIIIVKLLIIIVFKFSFYWKTINFFFIVTVIFLSQFLTEY